MDATEKHLWNAINIYLFTIDVKSNKDIDSSAASYDFDLSSRTKLIYDLILKESKTL